MFIFLRKDKKGVGRIFLPTPESIDPEKGPQEKIKSRIGEMVDKTTDPKERFKWFSVNCCWWFQCGSNCHL